MLKMELSEDSLEKALNIVGLNNEDLEKIKWSKRKQKIKNSIFAFFLIFITLFSGFIGYTLVLLHSGYPFSMILGSGIISCSQRKKKALFISTFLAIILLILTFSIINRVNSLLTGPSSSSLRYGVYSRI